MTLDANADAPFLTSPASFRPMGPAIARIGYRKLTWMMVDAKIACVGESTIYRVLNETDLLSRWKRSTVSSGEYNFRPNGPNQQWHTDVMYHRSGLLWRLP